MRALQGLLLSTCSLALGACAISIFPSTHWEHDPYRNVDVLKTTPIYVAASDPAVPSLMLQLIHVRGEQNSTLSGSYLSVGAVLHNVECRSAEFALDEQPFQPVSIAWSATLEGRVRFDAALDPARVAALGRAHTFKIRVCGDEYAMGDNPLGQGLALALHDFASAVAERDPAAVAP